MKSLNRIVLAVDDSPVADDVWREATIIAQTFGSEIYLVRAVVAPEYTPDFDLESTEAMAQIKDLKKLGEAEGIKVASRVTIRSGLPAEVINEVAAEVEADLILLGAGGKTTLGRILLGSTAEQVSREAKAPVWLVHPGTTRKEIKTIACAVDSSDPGREALAAAIFLARTFVAKLILVTVAPASLPPDPAALGAEQEKLKACLEAFDLHSVDAEFRVKRGKPAVEILELAEASKADLLVIGSAGRKGLARVFRANTAEKILRVVPCPLLTVHCEKG